MNRRLRIFSLLAAVFVAGAALTVQAATQVTFVFKNGARLSGTFSYHHDANYNLIISGKERLYASSEIAVIMFVTAEPTAKEISDLSVDGGPTEHDRHMITFRNGRTLRGKIYDFQGDNIVIDARDGSGKIARQTFAMSAVARLYVNAPASRQIFRAR